MISKYFAYSTDLKCQDPHRPITIPITGGHHVRLIVLHVQLIVGFVIWFIVVFDVEPPQLLILLMCASEAR